MRRQELAAGLRRIADLGSAAAKSWRLASHERWDRSELQRHQKQRLQELVRFAAVRSPFYHMLYAGIDIDGPLSIRELPVVTKNEMMASFDEYVISRGSLLGGPLIVTSDADERHPVHDIPKQDIIVVTGNGGILLRPGFESQPVLEQGRPVRRGSFMAAEDYKDAVTVAPHVYKGLFENSKVRVLEGRLRPGEKSEMHHHPAYLVYPLAPAKVRFSLPGGENVEASFAAGEVTPQDAGPHGVENIGSDDVHVLLIEFKE